MKSLLPLLVSGLAVAILSPFILAQEFTAISKSTAGAVGDDVAGEARISGDGRYVAFASKASNLVAGDTNGFFDVFLRDTVLGTTIRVSNGMAGAETNEESRWPEISEDGAFVLFSSSASNIVPGDTNHSADLFLYTVATGVIERVNLTHLGIEPGVGVQVDRDLYDLSDDGRYVVFTSSGDDYVTITTSNASRNVFLRDRTAGTTTLVSYKLGDASSAGGYAPSISGDGSLVAFVSAFWLLHPDDTDSNEDVFLFTTATGVVSLASYNSAGTASGAFGDSTYPILTPDGRYLAFESTCADLAVEDSNFDSDIYVRDLTTGITEVASYNRHGSIESGSWAKVADISADGRYLAFHGHLKTDAPTPPLGQNLYIRDRTLGTTALINHPRWWFPSIIFKAWEPQVTDSGDGVVIVDGIGTAEEGDTLFSQVNHIALETGVGTMSAMTFGDAFVGWPIEITIHDGPASAPVYILYSSTATGLSYAGHSFDIGAPASLLGTTTTDADGDAFWSVSAVPPSAAGRTIQIEVASTSGGVWYDSNRMEVGIF